MLSELQRERIVVVLVRARNPQNIGAAARAMHDFGLRHLRVVNEYDVPFEGARSAVDASAVLAKATAHAELAEAVADCTLVIGTTAVGERELRHPLLTLAEAAPRMRDELARTSEARVALLFGSEKTGLSNEELSFCHALLTIPMYPHPDVRHPSMNLGQAVAVCLYELVRAPGDALTSPLSAEQGGASSTELERITALLAQVLKVAEYNRRHPSHATEPGLRRLVLRMGLDRGSATIWMGMFRQILWKMQEGDKAARPHSE
jgi:TrmH family RNA methyltransferase